MLHCEGKYAGNFKNLVDPTDPWAYPHRTMSCPSSNVLCFYLTLFAKPKSIISGNSQSVNTPASCLGTQLHSANSGPPQGLKRVAAIRSWFLNLNKSRFNGLWSAPGSFALRGLLQKNKQRDACCPPILPPPSRDTYLKRAKQMKQVSYHWNLHLYIIMLSNSSTPWQLC